MSEYLTDHQVAAELQIGDVEVIRRLARSRQLAGFKVGRQWRFTRDAVRRFSGEDDPEAAMPAHLKGLHLPRRKAS